MNAKAFCPGHVTGFFEICTSKDLLSAGSKGAGMCLSLGATSLVEIHHASRQSIRATIDGRESRAEVTKSALRRLLGNERLAVKVTTVLDLPQSQGFGMSAAGALSSSIALVELLGRSRQEAFEAAHIAEIQHKCGLGDVSALHRGGITIRQKPGLPPIGKVLRIRGTPEVVLSVLGGKLLTRNILANPAKRRAINRSGAKRVDAILRRPSLEKLMHLSSSFAIESGLASRRIAEAMGASSKLGIGSMSMLGNSIFAVGDMEGLAAALSDFGPVWTCEVDRAGPRIL